jgi:hypothetical protein
LIRLLLVGLLRVGLLLLIRLLRLLILSLMRIVLLVTLMPPDRRALRIETALIFQNILGRLM